MSKHWEVLRVVRACMRVRVHLWRQDSELVTVTRSAETRRSRREPYERRGEKKKHKSVGGFSLILSYLCSHFSSTTTFITQLCIPCPFRFLAVFFFLSELNKCSLFTRTSAITVCFSLAKLLQGSHQQPSRLCHSPSECWKQRLRDFLLERTRRSFNLVKKGDSSSSLPPPLSPSICPCTPPSSSSTSPHTLHGSETERCQVSVLFTWTLGNVKVCLVWPQVRTISFLTPAWFTWPPLTLPLSVSGLNQRPLCVWLMQRAFLWACLLQSSFSLCPLSMGLCEKSFCWSRLSVCTANSEVPSSNMVLRESLSRPLLLVDIISTRQSFFSQS